MIDISTYQALINEELNDLNLPKSPKNLYAPLHYFLNIGGKRMRPILALMSCELFNQPIEKAKHSAMAVELFHNFSLIHDDIMDKAPLRRGQKTVHEKWDKNIAILSGDVLLIKAYDYLANYNSETFKLLFTLFNTTATQVCEGQQWDMDFENSDHVEINAYIKMITYKTAVLLGCSLKMGAIVANASEKDQMALYQFGLNLGIAFQLQDDLLDVYADKNKFGKQVGGDIIANKKTYLWLTAFQDANEVQKNSLISLMTEQDLELKIDHVKQIYSELDIQSKTNKIIDFYHKKALKNISDISVDDVFKKPLKDLSVYLMERDN